MELRHLRYFVAVAEALHFGRAAQELHMAQQPLSRQIRNLEEELAVSLFHRTKRTIQLTEAGQAFLQEARKTLAQADYAVTLAQKINRGEAGELKIGFTGPILNSVLPPVVRHFKRQFPNIHLELKRLPTNAQVEALLSGELHVGFLHPPIEAPAIRQEVIYQEPLVAVLPDNHQLSHKLSSYTRKLPPLTATMKISQKAAAAGFEWENIDGVWEKFHEELQEFEQALAQETPARQEAELGDLLFTILQIARWNNLDPSEALQGTNQRFITRLKIMESVADRPLCDYSLSELEALWQKAKATLEAVNREQGTGNRE